RTAPLVLRTRFAVSLSSRSSPPSDGGARAPSPGGTDQKGTAERAWRASGEVRRRQDERPSPPEARTMTSTRDGTDRRLGGGGRTTRSPPPRAALGDPPPAAGCLAPATTGGRRPSSARPCRRRGTYAACLSSSRVPPARAPSVLVTSLQCAGCRFGTPPHHTECLFFATPPGGSCVGLRDDAVTIDSDVVNSFFSARRDDFGSRFFTSYRISTARPSSGGLNSTIQSNLQSSSRRFQEAAFRPIRRTPSSSGWAPARHDSRVLRGPRFADKGHFLTEIKAKFSTIARFRGLPGQFGRPFRDPRAEGFRMGHLVSRSGTSPCFMVEQKNDDDAGLSYLWGSGAPRFPSQETNGPEWPSARSAAVTAHPPARLLSTMRHSLISYL
ncbi:hypothetical protein THAOC_01292, partial [Thalassiosira oceanica]